MDQGVAIVIEKKVLRAMIVTSDERGYKRNLRIFFCSLGHRTRIRANWVDNRIIEDGLSDVVLPLVTPYLDKSSLMSLPLGAQTKSSV